MWVRKEDAEKSETVTTWDMINQGRSLCENRIPEKGHNKSLDSLRWLEGCKQWIPTHHLLIQEYKMKSIVRGSKKQSEVILQSTTVQLCNSLPQEAEDTKSLCGLRRLMESGPIWGLLDRETQSFPKMQISDLWEMPLLPSYILFILFPTGHPLLPISDELQWTHYNNSREDQSQPQSSPFPLRSEANLALMSILCWNKI